MAKRICLVALALMMLVLLDTIQPFVFIAVNNTPHRCNMHYGVLIYTFVEYLMSSFRTAVHLVVSPIALHTDNTCWNECASVY